MADKKITLEIAGKSVTCNFGINYFYKHFKDITGIDMLLNGFGDTDGVNALEATKNILYAGYKAENSLNKSENGLTIEDFDHHLSSMDTKGVNDLMIKFVNIINPEQKGEPEAQTETH